MAAGDWVLLLLPQEGSETEIQMRQIKVSFTEQNIGYHADNSWRLTDQTTDMQIIAEDSHTKI